jgi:hypothetical protein
MINIHKTINYKSVIKTDIINFITIITQNILYKLINLQYFYGFF